MTTKQYVNNVGAAYFASNQYGWAVAKTPWQALQKLDLYEGRGKVNTFTSKKFEKATNHVCLVYLPDESQFDHVNWFRPCDSEGKFYGITLYAGDGSTQEQAVKEHLLGTAQSVANA